MQKAFRFEGISIMKLGVISCGGSNVTSVVNALGKAGYKASLLTTPDQKVDFLIMPGVGAFGAAIKRLNDGGFSEYLRQHVREGKPAIGICLGMQILFESSEEDEAVAGLGIFRGRFLKLLAHSSPELRSPPNIGYSYVSFMVREGSATKRDFSDLDGYYYFMHSYALKRAAASMDVVGMTRFNDETIVPFVQRANICGIQFHPERSGTQGLNLLARTIDALK
jgi:imidazole glycerol phosphate synthase glutamine amidotransferase subunit